MINVSYSEDLTTISFDDRSVWESKDYPLCKEAEIWMNTDHPLIKWEVVANTLLQEMIKKTSLFELFGTTLLNQSLKK